MSFTTPYDDCELPSTPLRSVRDPIPSTTPSGPPPPASQSLFRPKSPLTKDKAIVQSREGNIDALKRDKQMLSGASLDYGSSPPVSDDDIIGQENQDSLAGISPGIQTLRSSFLVDTSHFDVSTSPKRQKLDRLPGTTSPELRDVSTFAQSIIATQQATSLDTSDVLILRTETALEALTTGGIDHVRPEQAQALVSSVAKDLLQLWTVLYPIDPSDVRAEMIGPSADQAPPLFAIVLASLLLSIQHPTAWSPRSSRGNRPSKSNGYPDITAQSTIPGILTGWLAEFHDPGASIVDAVDLYQGEFFAAPEFWDAVISSLVRGNITRAASLLRNANIRHTSADAFTRPQLDYIEQALDIILGLLQACPAVQRDWDVKASSWDIFRLEVGQVRTQLRQLLEGEDGDVILSNNQPSFSLSRASRQAESRLPQEIYDNLAYICDILSGDENSIIDASYDWVEAVICLTIWWNGNDLDTASFSKSSLRNSLSTSTRSFRKSRQSRAADVTPILAYRQRLSSSFHIMLENTEVASGIDWNDSFQVSLCCIFQNEIDELLSIMKSWSVCVTAAVVEIGDKAGWLNSPGSQSRELDEADLMVLSYANDNWTKSVKNSTLEEYAQLLSPRAVLQDPDNGIHLEGWDMALSIVARISNGHTASKLATGLLETIGLDSNARVDKVIESCFQLGFEKQAIQIAEKYADKLARSGASYGDSLSYYSRAHRVDKLKDVLHGLITLCVVQSSAYPPANELDETMQKLLKSPRRAIRLLNTNDYDANHSLSMYLSGYATIRRFYQIRDGQAELQLSKDPTVAKIQQKKLAAAALIPTIISAANSIEGGVWDSSVDSVVPLHHLLVLLGESLALFNPLLKVVEDLEALTKEMYARCETSFSATIENAYIAGTMPSHELLRVSVSSLTSASDHFSTLGSSMLMSQILHPSPTASTEGSGVLLQGAIHRTWDWRKAMARNSPSTDVVKILRLGLSRELARVWIDEGDDLSLR